MAEKKYVGAEALIRLVAQLKAGFASLVHTHKIEDIEDYVVDDALSSTSKNPVQNKAVNAAISSNLDSAKSYTDSEVAKVTGGTIIVKEAEHAESADSASTATNANHATTADSATSATSATTAGSATKATQDGNGKVISETYQTIANATSQHNTLQSSIDAKADKTITINGKSLASNITLTASDVNAATTAYVDDAEADANKYTDDAIANLLDNDTAAVDSIMELAAAMENNADAIDALRDIAGGKADAGHTHDDRYYTESEIDSKISTINTSINGKAAKATTLSGYGITDAYTKTQVDSTVSDLEEAIDGKAASSHGHAIADVSGLQSALDGKAAASHGNHVPATQTANNAVFLRNDNTWATVTPANIGAATSGHTHKYAGSSSAGGAANSVANSIAIKLNGGTTEGTNLFTFNGSSAKTVNITPSSIGAQASGDYAAASHTHDGRYYTESEIDSKVSTLNTAINGKAASSHTHSISDITGLEERLAAIEAMLISITDTEIDEICG